MHDKIRSATKEAKIARLIVVLAVASFLMALPSCAASVDPTHFQCDDNVPLEDLYPDDTSTEVFIVETDDVIGELVGGQWNDLGYGIEIWPYFNDDDPPELISFDWRSQNTIGAILVKSAQCQWVYDYLPGGATGDTDLISPGVGPIGQIQGISHTHWGFISIPEFPLLVCGMLGIMGVLGMVYFQKSRKE